MAAISVTPKWSGIEGSARSDDGLTGTTDSVRVFEVVVDAPATDSEITARAAVGVPRLREPHPGNLFLRCNSVQARRTSLLTFDVICSYAAPTPNDDHPTSVAPKIRVFTVTSQEGVDEDVDGKPIVTACGESFPPLPHDQKDQGIEIVVATYWYDHTSDSLFYNLVNSDTFLGYPPGTCRIIDRSADAVISEDDFYWMVRTEIHVRRGAPRTSDAKAWWRRLRHEGLYYRPAAGQKPIRAKDAHGKETAKPVLLKEDGTRVPDAIPPAEPEAEWIERQEFPTGPYAALNLF